MYHPKANPLTLDGPYRRPGLFSRLVCLINWRLRNLFP